MKMSMPSENNELARNVLRISSDLNERRIAPIKLTKFCSLDDCGLVVTDSTDNELENVSKSREAMAKKSRSVNNVPEVIVVGSSVMNQKTHNPINKLQLAPSSSSLASGNSDGFSKCEPFQVIWRELAFEVDHDSLTQVASKSLSRIKSFWTPEFLRRRQKSDDLCKNGNSSANDLEARETRDQNSGSTDHGRVVFENLNGFANSGEITAILGPSGAGKTSLLNAICGRTKGYRGSVSLAGGVSDKRRMRLSIIPQKDYLMENLTVMENLLYSSQILNSNTNYDHKTNIMRVATKLSLTDCLDSSTGSISGGEYKRVSIAQELLRRPDILVLDEPTSGLDSMNCKNLIKLLRDLIETSRIDQLRPIAIVMTIHQPDIDIFQMFDRVYCLAPGGRVIFDGHPSEALDVLKAHANLEDGSEMAAELMLDSPSGFVSARNTLGKNPANLLIEIASGQLHGQSLIDNLSKSQRKKFEASMGGVSASRAQQIGKPISQTTESSNGSILPNSGLMASQASIKSHQLAKMDYDKRLKARAGDTGQFWHRTSVLVKRSFVSSIRDPMMVMVSLLFHLSIPFGMSVVFSKLIGVVTACPLLLRQLDILGLLSEQTMDKVLELQLELSMSFECAMMFFLTTYAFSMCSISVAALTFPLNMHVLLKEVRNGWYKLPSFVIAKSLASFPFEVIFPSISSMLIYYMLDMPSSYLQWRMFAIAFVVALVAMVSTTHGLIFGTLFMDSPQSAVFLGIASTMPMVLLGGVARTKYMPWLLQKLSFLSLYRYSTWLIDMIRFGFDTCPCDQQTDAYLKTHKPELLGVPVGMKNFMSYYLAGSAADTDNDTDLVSETPETTTTVAMDSLVAESTINSTMTLNLTSTMIVPRGRILGISYDMSLNSTARDLVAKRLDAEEIDIFAQMATLMTKSFTYGRNITDCSSVRSHILITAGTPPDAYLPHCFGALLLMLVVYRLILFIVVKCRLGSRI